MNDLTVSGAKALARGMIERMAAVGVPMTLAQALEGVAAAHHYQDWNRFRDALKHSRVPSSPQQSSPFTPHRLIATKPGNGSGAVLDHHFLFEARQPDALPIMLFFDIAYTASYFFNVIIPDTKATEITALYDVDAETIIFDGEIPADCTGIVLNVVGTRDGLPDNIFRLTPDQKMPAWKALCPLIPSLLNTQQMTMSGTLHIPDFHHIARENSSEYDIALPELMARLRSQGGKKSLVVVTQTEDARASLYRSPDDWRLIMMDGDDSKMFYRCPFYRVSVYFFSEAIQTYFARIFSDPERALEDAALFIGALSARHYRAPLPTDAPYALSIINYLEGNAAWHTKRHAKETAPTPVKVDHRKVL